VHKNKVFGPRSLFEPTEFAVAEGKSPESCAPKSNGWP